MFDTDAWADAFGIPLQKETITCAGQLGIALAHANVARLSEAAAKPCRARRAIS